MKNCDVFLTHAWRFHQDWVKFSELLSSDTTIKWRNFSLPWHDPAMNPNTENGGAFIRDSLERQIIPVDCVIVLSGVYVINSARKWVDMEIEIARKYKKFVIGVPDLEQNSMNETVKKLCDNCCDFNVPSLVSAIVGSRP